jgi:hypothetical protein
MFAANSDRTYTITIFGEVQELTMMELRTFLTREAYDLYFEVKYQGGTVTFDRGALCSAELMEEYYNDEL